MMGGCLMAIDLSMLGWILHRAGKSPTIINGADMKNFIDVSSPFASARIGEGEVFVSEVDESDGSITFFEPRVAVVNPLPELLQQTVTAHRKVAADRKGRTPLHRARRREPFASARYLSEVRFARSRGDIRGEAD
jgi:hypothetical protein